MLSIIKIVENGLENVRDSLQYVKIFVVPVIIEELKWVSHTTES